LTLFDPDVDEAAPLEGPLLRLRATVAYDGGGFHGFAANPGVKTVAGTLATTLGRVLGHPVRLVCAGRTDAGVHGWGQVISFDTQEPAEVLDLEAILRKVNRVCGPSVVLRDLVVADPQFDARRSAKARHYRYTIVNRAVPDPFLAKTAWHVAEPLDLAVMRLACDPLIGEHDFSAFCRVPRGVDAYTMVRRVLYARWVDLGDDTLRFEIGASSFCQQMVRSVVGLLVDVGRGKRTAADVLTVRRSTDRAQHGANIAPAHGLCLWSVDY
jgi:tRNA pseudouridine38-40 synthase